MFPIYLHSCTPPPFFLSTYKFLTTPPPPTHTSDFSNYFYFNCLPITSIIHHDHMKVNGTSVDLLQRKLSRTCIGFDLNKVEMVHHRSPLPFSYVILCFSHQNALKYSNYKNNLPAHAGYDSCAAQSSMVVDCC